MNLYLASTSGNSGKTLVALGLAKIWAGRGVSVGYVKPLGKIPVVTAGGVVDEDAAFLAKELGLPGPPETTCPVVMTQDLVISAYRGEPIALRERVDAAIGEASSRCEVLLVGGAANLRDGIFLGLPPLEIIAAHGCRVLLVDRFEGEKSMDQVLWAAGVLGDRLLGVVLNRVDRTRETFVRDMVRPFFDSRGIRIFGAVPADPLLDSVTVAALAAAVSATVESGEDRLDAMVERFCVGAMDVESALRVFRRIPRKAVVTGGSRADIQLAALETDTRCLVLTGGVPPNDLIVHKAEQKGVPILVCRDDTMATVERLEKMVGRLRIREREKIARGVGLVSDHVDAAGILASLRGGR
ncbi:MAG: DRTGG domain-containing protein [Gemmatimonadota bacterium]